MQNSISPFRSIHPSIHPSKIILQCQLSNNKIHILYFDHIYEIFSKEDFDALYSREFSEESF